MDDASTTRSDAGSMMLAGPWIMVLSAALFGYFGFWMRPLSTGPQGQIVFLFALFAWTLKLSAIGFALSAGITFVRPLLGNMLYSVVSLLGAGAFVLVLVLDLLDTSRTVAISPVLLLLFAAWNGYGFWTGLQAVAAVARLRRELAASPDHPLEP